MNAAFSGFSGAVLLLFSNEMSRLFDVSAPEVFFILGFGLLIFSAFVAFTASKMIDNWVLVLIISIADLLWVTGSILIIAFDLFALSGIGQALIGLVALLIAYFGMNQLKHAPKKS